MLTTALDCAYEVCVKPMDDNDFVRSYGHEAFDPVAGDPFEFPTGGNGSTDRPTIVIRTAEREVIDEAIAALASDPHVFHRGGELVHVIADEGKPGKIVRPPGAPRIVRLPQARLRELMSDTASWLKVTKEGKKPAHPPNWAVAGIDARGTWPALRSLEAVVECPVLRPDGTVLDEPGYDAATGLLLIPRGRFAKLPARPTNEDARHAVESLLDVVRACR